MAEENSRCCKKCNIVKDLGEFYNARSRTGKYYRVWKCNSCVNAHNRERYNTGPEERRQALRRRSRNWKDNNPQRLAEYEARNFEKHRKRDQNYGLVRNFGITMDEYNLLLHEQKGVCAICQKPETAMQRGIIKLLAVDHCHTTGKIRGLLCGRCNPAIGCFREDESIILAAIIYLQKNNKKLCLALENTP